MLTVRYKKKDTVTSMISVDFKTKKVTVENFTDRLLDTAFGVRDNPTMDDFKNLLQSRCFPKERRDCKQILDMLGVECYDPLAICEKTHGRMEDDFYSMDFAWD